MKFSLLTVFYLFIHCYSFAQTQKSEKALNHDKIQKLDTIANDNFDLTMVRVKGGTFLMGLGAYYNDQKPTHSVTLCDFSIGKYEITVGEFRKFIVATNFKTTAELNTYSYVFNGTTWDIKKGVTWEYGEGGLTKSADNIPVVSVSWNDADSFCVWLSKVTGRKYRLPTEAEWEYAAIGGNQSKGFYYSGSNNPDSVAWYEGKSHFMIHPIGTKFPNELGIYDMSGNVAEWCSDWYGAYTGIAQSNPVGANTGYYKVHRGGHWNIAFPFCWVRNRAYNTIDYCSDYVGFRVVCEN